MVSAMTTPTPPTSSVPAPAALHVVLGAGQVGSLLIDRLRRRGHPVRVVTRRGGPSSPGIEQLAGDVADPAVVAAAARGAEVVYHCVNPAYDRWDELLAPMTRGIVEGTARAGARLVALD